MKFEIRNRFTGDIQFTAEIKCNEGAKTSIKIGLAVKWPIKTRANLAGADLAGADLARAYLARAYLADANLAGAYLARADLAGADLAGADLAGAYLAGADLARANLAGANLAGANLARAYLADANLAGAYLARADLADVSKIEESNIPVIPQIDAVILAAIEAGGTLDMSTWHGDGGWCGTTHCRAGWAVHCAGQPGRDLEEKVGTQIAAAMIYRASRPGQAAPWFYASDEKTMADIRKCAAEQIGESKP